MRTTSLALALLLAACGDQPADPAPEAPAETPIPVEPDGGIGDGAGPPPRTATAAAAIPVPFLGVWDTQTGTCDPASDLRLEIEEDKITFYESVGKVESVREDEGTTLVTLAMEGEGQRWTQIIGLRFFDAGTSLMVIDPERPADAEQNMRRRCFD